MQQLGACQHRTAAQHHAGHDGAALPDFITEAKAGFVDFLRSSLPGNPLVRVLPAP